MARAGKLLSATQNEDNLPAVATITYDSGFGAPEQRRYKYDGVCTLDGGVVYQSINETRPDGTTVYTTYHSDGSPWWSEQSGPVHLKKTFDWKKDKSGFVYLDYEITTYYKANGEKSSATEDRYTYDANLNLTKKESHRSGRNTIIAAYGPWENVLNSDESTAQFLRSTAPNWRWLFVPVPVLGNAYPLKWWWEAKQHQTVLDNQHLPQAYWWRPKGETLAEISDDPQLRRKTEYKYDRKGYLEKTIVSIDKSTQAETIWRYDERGNIKSIKDPRGYTTTIVYDDELKLYPKEITKANGLVVKSTYDPRFGKIATSTDENGQTTTYKYESGGGWGA
jgi:hypothetical protein